MSRALFFHLVSDYCCVTENRHRSCPLQEGEWPHQGEWQTPGDGGASHPPVQGERGKPHQQALCLFALAELFFATCSVPLTILPFFHFQLLEPVLLLGKERFAGVDIRVRVKGGGHVAQIYGKKKIVLSCREFGFVSFAAVFECNLN